MSKKYFQKVILKHSVLLVVLVTLFGCVGQDTPFTINNGGGSSGEPTNPGVGVPPSQTPGNEPGAGACFVNFTGTLTLALSADPAGEGAPDSVGTEILTAPIPIEVNGSEVKLYGSMFPPIYYRFTDPGASADILITAKEDVVGTGTYDSSTKAMEINNFTFGMGLIVVGTTDPLMEGTEWIDGINLRTSETVTLQGNSNQISDTGYPVGGGDGATSIKLVAGKVLPTNFTTLPVLNNEIGGGALIASFEGNLDQLPENCVSSGGGGGGPIPPPSGTEGGTDAFGLMVDAKAVNGSFNYGVSEVVTKKFGDNIGLNCAEPGGRGIIVKDYFFKNKKTDDLLISSISFQDTDNEGPKNPGCGGDKEFFAITLWPLEGSQCPGNTLPCTLPPNGELRVSSAYRPYNFFKVQEGDQPPDTGRMIVGYDDNKSYEVELQATSIESVRGIFSLVKVKEDGTESVSKIADGGTLKIALPNSNEYIQNLRILNIGSDDWDIDEINVTSLAENDPNAYSVEPGHGASLPSGDTVQPGFVDFAIKFDPTISEGAVPGALNIVVKKAGSTNANTIKFNLNGTVKELVPGADSSYQVFLQIDYLSGLIDHSVLSKEPASTVAFRVNQGETAPPPMPLKFEKIGDSELYKVSFDPEDPPLDMGQDANLKPGKKSSRSKEVRIFNARGTTVNGATLSSTGTTKECLDAEPADVGSSDGTGYQDGDCSYFYVSLNHNDLTNNPGVFNPDTGSLILPDLTVGFANTHHALLGDLNPSLAFDSNPNNHINTTLQMSLSTVSLNALTYEDINYDGLLKEFALVPDPNIQVGQLNMKDRLVEADCPEDYFNSNDVDVTKGAVLSPAEVSALTPHMRCYVSGNGGAQFLHGTPITLRQNQPDKAKNTWYYDIVLVGIGQFPGGNDPNMPFFLEGTPMGVAIQGRVIVKKDASFKDTLVSPDHDD